jgi:MFS transporter, DHA2 family, multidrug resistance protein
MSATTVGDEEFLSPGRRFLVALAIMPAGAMQATDTFATSIAMPTMMGSLSATVTEISWVITSYLVASAMFTPLYAWTSRKVGRKRLFVGVIVGFLIASLLVAQSTTLYELIAFRFVQGFFGAGLNPLTFQMVLATFPKNQHGPAFGWMQTGRMSAVVVGPVLGGILTEFVDWRAVYLMNIPFGLFALFMIARVVPKDIPEQPKSFDFFGFFALSIAIASMQLMLDQGEKRDWFDSNVIVTYCMIAGAAFYVFAIHCTTSLRPYLNPLVFRNREFVIGLTIDFFISFIFFGFMALLPQVLQRQMGFPVMETGFVLMYRGIGTMVASLASGFLMLRVSPRPLIAIGIISITLSNWVLAGLTPDTDTFPIILAILLQGFGIGFMSTPTEAASFQTLPPSLRPDAASVMTAVRRIAAGIGVSILIAQLVSREQTARAALMENVSRFSERFRDFPMPESWNPDSLQGMLGLERVIGKQAQFMAYLFDFELMAIITLCALPLPLLMRRRKAED